MVPATHAVDENEVSWFLGRPRAQQPATQEDLNHELRDWKVVTIENSEQGVPLTVRLKASPLE